VTLPPVAECGFEYLEPAGFSVDLYESPHNDVSTQTFVPVEAPWINASGEWLFLPNPQLGEYRASPIGTVFNHSAGANGLGYAICLTCGRSEPMVSEPDDEQGAQGGVALPTVFRSPHRRLRGAQGGDTKTCDSNSFAIRPGIRLGHEAVTDVLELRLFDLDGRLLSDHQIAFSLAVAIRGAIASILGVEVTELGCSTKPIRLVNGITGLAIVLFDHNASGYCSSISDRLRDVFSKARDILNCKADCEAACQHCLLDFDTRFRQDDIDRKAALEFLTERWLDEFRLKNEDAQFGPSTRAEFQTLPEAITRELAHAGVEELRLFLVGDPSDWDIAASPLRGWVQKWAAGTGAVRLVLPPNAEDGLSQQDRFALSVLSNLEGVSIWTGEASPCLAGGQTIAELVVAGRAPLAWAYRSSTPANPNSQWAIGGEFLVRGQPKTAGKLLQQVSIAVDIPADIKGKTHRFEISSELDGTSEGFGRRLLARLEDDLGGKLISGKGEIIRVSYQDRYLNAPLPVALLLDFISTLKMEYKDRWSVQAIELVVSPFQEQGGFSRPIYVYHNWPTVTDRGLAIQAAFNYCGMDTNLRSIDKRDAIHARLLEIERDDGNTLKIWLDQEFSFWQAQSPYRQDLRFPFVKGAAEQGQMIAKAQMDLVGQSFPTYLFVEG
jgi:hypothetical protein